MQEVYSHLATGDFFMLASELRRQYIEFFISKGSKQIASSSLVPNDCGHAL